MMSESLVNLKDDQVDDVVNKSYKRLNQIAGEVEDTIARFLQTGMDYDELDEVEVRLKEMKRILAIIKEALSKGLENDRKELKRIMEKYDAEEDRVISFVTQSPLQYMIGLLTGKTR